MLYINAALLGMIGGFVGSFIAAIFYPEFRSLILKSLSSLGKPSFPIAKGVYSIILPPILVIIIGELFIFQGRLIEGIALHAFNLLGLAVSTIFIKDKIKVDLVQAFFLVSLLRLVDTSMPTFFTLTLYWYPLIYTPMFISIYLVLRYQKPALSEIGITFRHLYLYIPLGLLIGLVIALLEYRIILPSYLIPSLSISNIVVLSIVMIMFVGLVEELIFRSILLTKLERAIGVGKGLLLASIVFGVMHSGFGTIYEIFFAIFAGLVIGFIFLKTRSLPFIAVIHGSTNVFLYGIIPLFFV
jgi:membrane protease YdiL (CAAX protease family)